VSISMSLPQTSQLFASTKNSVSWLKAGRNAVARWTACTMILLGWFSSSIRVANLERIPDDARIRR
jgi:hypothetical protein